MFLRWPATVILVVVGGLILFKIFTWLLNSHYLSGVIKSVARPRAETVEEIASDLSDARHVRDQRLDENQDTIDQAIEESQDLRNL